MAVVGDKLDEDAGAGGDDWRRGDVAAVFPQELVRLRGPVVDLDEVIPETQNRPIRVILSHYFNTGADSTFRHITKAMHSSFSHQNIQESVFFFFCFFFLQSFLFNYWPYFVAEGRSKG